MCLLLHIRRGHLLFEWQSQLGHGGCRCIYLCVKLIEGHGYRGMLLPQRKVMQDEGIKGLRRRHLSLFHQCAVCVGVCDVSRAHEGIENFV